MGDNQQIMTVYPPNGGFWEKGNFGSGKIWGSKMAPFDQDFYMIFNVAVGGTIVVLGKIPGKEMRSPCSLITSSSRVIINLAMRISLVQFPCYCLYRYRYILSNHF